MYNALSSGEREGKRAILVLTRCLFQAVGLAPRKRGMAREAPQARGPHGNNDAQVAPAVRVQQDQDGGALPGRQGVPEREGRRSVRPKAVEGSLAEGVSEGHDAGIHLETYRGEGIQAGHCRCIVVQGLFKRVDKVCEQVWLVVVETSVEGGRFGVVLVVGREPRSRGPCKLVPEIGDVTVRQRQSRLVLAVLVVLVGRVIERVARVGICIRIRIRIRARG